MTWKWRRTQPRVYWLYRDGEEFGLVFGAPEPAQLWCAIAWVNDRTTSVDYAGNFRSAKQCVVNALRQAGVTV